MINLVKTKCIDSAKKIWWDLRVHPVFNTVEFRICDIPLLAEESIALSALFQAICAKLYKLRMQNMNFMMYSRALINENKFRASRYGLEGRMIDFGKEEEVSTKGLIAELLDFIDDVVPNLGSEHFIKKVSNILENGTKDLKANNQNIQTSFPVNLFDIYHCVIALGLYLLIFFFLFLVLKYFKDLLTWDKMMPFFA